jgi:hypothetical protein
MQTVQTAQGTQGTQRAQGTQRTPTDENVTGVHAHVFPVEVDRWIAVEASLRGTFVIECPCAAGVASRIRHATDDTLGGVPEMEPLDDRGMSWSPGQARFQLARMGLGGREPVAVRRSWFKRILAQR